jgi:hypothetical protein
MPGLKRTQLFKRVRDDCPEGKHRSDDRRQADSRKIVEDEVLAAALNLVQPEAARRDRPALRRSPREPLRKQPMI